MEAVLVILGADGSGSGRLFPVQKESTTIGRREDCDLRVPLANVSRTHCKVIRDDANGVLRVEDLGSSNGTLVNGARVQVAALSAGDIISVGPVRLAVQIDGEPALSEISAKSAQRPTAPERAAPVRAKAPGKPKSLEEDIDAILAGEDESGDSRDDIKIDFDAPK